MDASVHRAFAKHLYIQSSESVGSGKNDAVHHGSQLNSDEIEVQCSWQKISLVIGVSRYLNATFVDDLASKYFSFVSHHLFLTISTAFFSFAEKHKTSCVDKHNVYDITELWLLVLQSSLCFSARLERVARRLSDSLFADGWRFVVDGLDDSDYGGVVNNRLWLRIHEPDYQTLISLDTPSRHNFLNAACTRRPS